MLKLSILCDDTVASGEYLTEHGLSVLVELRGGPRWLLDTGTTDVFLRNARRMGASLDGLAGIAISHGHDDHAGGLAFCDLLEGAPPVYGHPHIWQKQYEVREGAPLRVLGMTPQARKYAHPRFRPVRHTTNLDEGLFFLTDIPRAPGSYTPTDGKFFNEDGTGPCPILDDATLAVKTPAGLVLVFGCAHAGYVNILEAVRDAFPGERLLSVVGGLHLAGAGEKVLENAVAVTDSLKTEEFTFYGGHCTGEKAIRHFRERYGDKAVKPLGAGRVIAY